MRIEDDLTARARLREAAIELFAERGYAATSVGMIAERAGVTAGLIRHHFGSKDGLRQACDQQVLTEALTLKGRALAAMEQRPEIIPEVEPRSVLIRRYLGRSMIDGGEGGSASFHALLNLTERFFADNPVAGIDDPRATAAATVGMQVGLMVMQDQLANALGDDGPIAERHRRVLAGAAHLFHPDLLDTAAFADFRRWIDHHSPASPPKESR
ncbi:helix-turn-helix domain-containing protein [Janibacter sp. GXQ6167]|uniref:TetR/AcrR family transcriptional regulator n=1 Tax=Janibacter sp. GXQ6167 TaxID=3240791 RepID=UPI0035236A33